MRVRNLPACLKLKGKFPVSKVILLTCWFSSTWQKNALLFQSFRTVYSLWWVFCLFVLFILYVCLVFLFVCFALYIIFDKNCLMCGKLLVKLPMNLSLRIFYCQNLLLCYNKRKPPAVIHQSATGLMSESEHSRCVLTFLPVNMQLFVISVSWSLQLSPVRKVDGQPQWLF